MFGRASEGYGSGEHVSRARCASVRQNPGVPRPLISAETIYEAALTLIEEGGIDALNMRNLTASLRCSTKTIYQQVGNREDLERGLIAYAFGQMSLQFTPGKTASKSITAFASTLRSALLADPGLAALMTTADRDAIVEYAVQLVDALKGHGLREHDAVEAAGIVNHVTLSMTLADISAPGEWDRPEVFDTALRWLIQGLLKDYPKLR